MASGGGVLALFEFEFGERFGEHYTGSVVSNNQYSAASSRIESIFFLHNIGIVRPLQNVDLLVSIRYAPHFFLIPHPTLKGLVCSCMIKVSDKLNSCTRR